METTLQESRQQLIANLDQAQTELAMAQSRMDQVMKGRAGTKRDATSAAIQGFITYCKDQKEAAGLQRESLWFTGGLGCY